MNTSKRSTAPTLKLCATAVMAALVYWGSQLQIQIPAVLGFSRFHLGNVTCALSGLLLGPGWGGLAAGLGSALFDVTNPAYIAEAPITFVTKGLYGLIAGLVHQTLFHRRDGYLPAAVSTACAAVSYALIYLTKNFLYNGLLLSGLTPAGALVAMMEKVPSAVFNGSVAILLAPVLYAALARALKAAHLDRILN